MRKLPYGLFFSTLFLLPSASYAGSLMTCENKGGYETNCYLTEYSLAVKTSVERSFLIQYTMPCIGHEISVGIQDQTRKTFWPFKQSGATETLPIESYGPLMTFDPDRSWTASADFQVGCQLVAKVIEMDLSTTEKKNLNLLVDSIKSQESLVGQVLRLSSNVTLLKTIIVQLDIKSIASILAEKYVDTGALADSYEKQNKADAAAALRTVQDDLKAAICLSPALSEEHRDICTELSEGSQPSEAEVKKTLTEKATTALTELGTASDSVVKLSVDRASELVVSMADVLAYASESTASDATTKVCPSIKNLNIKTTICK